MLSLSNITLTFLFFMLSRYSASAILSMTWALETLNGDNFLQCIHFFPGEMVKTRAINTSVAY